LCVPEKLFFLCVLFPEFLAIPFSTYRSCPDFPRFPQRTSPTFFSKRSPPFCVIPSAPLPLFNSPVRIKLPLPLRAFFGIPFIYPDDPFPFCKHALPASFPKLCSHPFKSPLPFRDQDYQPSKVGLLRDRRFLKALHFSDIGCLTLNSPATRSPFRSLFNPQTLCPTSLKWACFCHPKELRLFFLVFLT